MERYRLYDNGGKTADRYTLVFMDQPERQPGTFTAFGFNREPTHPMGIGMHCSAMPGRHLGLRIALDALPTTARPLIDHLLEN